MGQIGLAVLGVGWIGAIRAKNSAAHPLVESLHLADIDAERARLAAEGSRARSWTTDYHDLLVKKEVGAVIVSTTPETTHFPIARDCLLAGKHTLLEKPMGLTLKEADELITIAKDAGLQFTIGYTQRFNPKYAYAKKCIAEGTLGSPVTALVSRNVSRSIGTKIGGRVKLSPAVMEATHDIDFLLWCLEGLRVKRVYAQSVYRVMEKEHGVPDCTWIVVTMDDGTVFTIGAGWILPQGYPHFSCTNIEIVGSDGSIYIDDTHRDVILNTTKAGMVFPLSTMPGEFVAELFQGPMRDETFHFIECVALGRRVLVTAEEARRVMEVTLAADLSAEQQRPIDLPLPPA